MNLRNIAFLTVFIFCVYGCGQDVQLVDDPTASLEIGFNLAAGAPAQSNVTRIELTLSTPDMDEPQSFSITNVGQGEHTASRRIPVPVASSVTFSVKAFDGLCPVFSGLRSMAITPDTEGPIDITLAPVQTVVGIRSEQAQLSMGNRYELEIYIEDAPELVSMTCELEFDENLLEPLEVNPGEFFGTNVLFIEDSGFLRREENQLSMGITLRGDVTGVCGSGVVFRVAFRAAGSGNTVVRLMESVTLMTTGFEQIEDSSRVRIESDSFVKIE